MDIVQAFDPVKYRLGSLCKRGHEWNGTGRTLRYNGSYSCLKCAAITAYNRAMPSLKRPGLLSLTAVERFYLYVDRREPLLCWEWLGWKDKDGYGKFRVDSSHSARAHRFAWEIANNQSIPSGMVIRHLCNNPSCCNHFHLAVGTSAENRADCVDAKRHAHGESHPYSKLSTLDVSRLKGLHAKGVPPRELARYFKVTAPCINSILGGHNWADVQADDTDLPELNQFDRSLALKGDDCPNSKLTTEKVIRIKQMLKAGMTQAAIAAQFGVDRSTIGYIKMGKNWKHVD